MQSVEAITHLIKLADEAIKEEGVLIVGGGDLELEVLTLAAAVATAMLNTALPVAKYRCFVEIDPEQTKAQKKNGVTVPYREFTICSVDMDGIISGLVGLTAVELQCRISLFEQRATGANMLLAYDGKSKTQSYRTFIGQLVAMDRMATPVVQ